MGYVLVKFLEGHYVDCSNLSDEQYLSLLEDMSKSSSKALVKDDKLRIEHRVMFVGIKDGAIWFTDDEEDFKSSNSWRLVEWVQEPPSKYHVKNIFKDEEWVDFYMYYDQLKAGKPHCVGDSAIEHALKKASQAGARSGGKSKVQDLKEAIWSLTKAVEMIEKC